MKIRLGFLALALALALASPSAQAGLTTFTENFEGGSNVGGWTFGNDYDEILPTGGNPGAFLFNDWLDTIGPAARTTQHSESVFTGDYRERGVVAVGADFALFRVDFTSVGRSVTLMLYSDAGTRNRSEDDCWVYVDGGKAVPPSNGNWMSYRFDVPSSSDALPPRWVAWQCGTRTPDEAWNLVIRDVDQIRYFWADPEMFYIFQMWEVGLDNPWIEYGDADPLVEGGEE